ncbi:MAG: hypothetical protein ACI4QR_05590 [Eubacteriales bacterium]
MFEKLKIRHGIKKYKKQICIIEQKRYRSQAALVEAILTNTTPSDDDVDYFNRYTAEIEEYRRKIHELEIQLKNI